MSVSRLPNLHGPTQVPGGAKYLLSQSHWSEDVCAGELTVLLLVVL